MRSSLHKNVNALSPESTVTSLLSSSGHLTSNLQPPAHNSSFSYKDKEYDSASSALDAYITDFERSRRRDVLNGAGLVLPPSFPRENTLSTLRNKDVLRERLSERELDFLSLPVSSLRHRGNRDRISMTTDELLNLPDDGSMPITHTTAFIHSLLSKSGASHSRSPVKNSRSLNHTPRASHPITTLRCSRCGGGTQFSNTLQPEPGATLSQGAGPASAPPPNWLSSRDQATMHLPHWLSSNKAALDCSEIHSLPDLPYPPWIRHCHDDQSERSYSKQGRSQDGEIEDFPASAPSWVQDLDEDQQQLDSELSLKKLRLQFAEHISHLASEKTDSVDSLYRDGKIQSLIQKADRVLDSLQNSATGSPVPPESQDQTEELLLRDLDPNLTRADQLSAAAELQPGLFEALKQILFRLQAVETELHRRHNAQQGALLQRTVLQDSRQQGAVQEKHRLQDTLQGAQLTDDQSAEADGGPSLQRALLHLSRLKLLVDKPQTSEAAVSVQRGQQAEEEERDEGRYSSSSTEQQQGAPKDTQLIHKDKT